MTSPPEPPRPERLVTLAVASAEVAVRRNRGETVVFTNGCFDLLHPGHVLYLEQARALGDWLIVGLNSDRSVRELAKGVERPILSEVARASILAGLRAVDRVVIFDEPTPARAISSLLPDLLCKGGDYRPEDVVGRQVVEENGGRVVILPFHPGFSSTDIIAKIGRGLTSS